VCGAGTEKRRINIETVGRRAMLIR